MFDFIVVASKAVEIRYSEMQLSCDQTYLFFQLANIFHILSLYNSFFVTQILQYNSQCVVFVV